MGGTTTGDDDDDRVSLEPLDPEMALQALLRVKPEDEPTGKLENDREAPTE